jgi:hypothetical protein
MNRAPFSNLTQHSATSATHPTAAESTSYDATSIPTTPETGPAADDKKGTEQSIPRIVVMPNGTKLDAAQPTIPEETADPRTFSTADPFDLARLRLSQSFADNIGVKKALLTVPVCKPHRQWFVRVHPDPNFHLEFAVLELKEDRDTYLVDPALLPELPSEVVPKILFTSITRQGVVFLWPVRLPSPDGRRDEWGRSSLEAAEIATRRWIRVASNLSLGAYEVFEAAANLPEPEWPDVTFKQLVEIAFRDRLIRTLDHPAIKKLRGEI